MNICIMNFEIVISIISLVVAAASFAVTSVYAYKNHKQTKRLSKEQHDLEEKLLNRQQQLAVLTEYTGRYERIVESMPKELMSDQSGIQTQMMLYFDLCSEEFYLHKKGLLSDEIWEMWLDGMRFTTKVQSYKTYWIELSPNYNDDFCNFFNKEVVNHVRK